MGDSWKIESESDGQYITGELNGADVYIEVQVNAGRPIPPTLDAHMALEAAPLHLIAAAPQLLEALTVAVTGLDCLCYSLPRCPKCLAEDAIAAATLNDPEPEMTCTTCNDTKEACCECCQPSDNGECGSCILVPCYECAPSLSTTR